MSAKWLLAAPALLALWVAKDMTISQTTSLTRFDGREVGRLETAMWRSYYAHQRLRLFGELVDLMRHQYHLPFWRANLAAWHAARAAVVFQRGHNRAGYELALPDLRDYYTIIRRSSDRPFSVDTVARLELEWWIVHRERARHAPQDLERSLAALQAAIFQRPEALFREHAKSRAVAMSLCDAVQAGGHATEQDWGRIEALLDSSWTSLHEAVVQY